MGPMTINAPSITPLCKPVFYKGKQSIDSRTQIEITCDSPSAAIYFSVNGRTPDPFETWNLNTVTMRYTKPFALKGSDKPRTVKAVAVNEKLKQKSPVVTKSFNVAAHPASPKQRKKMSIAEIDDNKSSEKVAFSCEENSAELNISQPEKQENEEQEKFHLGEAVLTKNEIDDTALPRADAELGDLDLTDTNCSLMQQDAHNDVIKNAKESDNKVDQCMKMNEQHLQPHDGNNVTEGLQDPELVIEEQLHHPVDTDREIQPSDLDDAGETLPPKDQTVIQNCNQEIKSETEKETELHSTEAVFDEHAMVKLQAKSQQADKYVQAVADNESRTTQTDPEIHVDQPKKVLPSRNPPLQRAPNVQMVSKKVGNEFKEESKSSQTFEEERTESKEQGCQTEERQHRSRISNHVHKGSPGRGYWRQQIDHITNQLKTEAYNNPDFQEMISEPSLAQINHVNVHEGLDELILVINIAIQRPTAPMTK